LGNTTRNAGKCIISGFHSQIEQDVLHYFLKGTQPIIAALARGLKQKKEPVFKEHIASGRLLVITSFAKEITRITEKTALGRNKLMIELANDITVGYANPEGQLSILLRNLAKPVMYL
jgi:hypothetical protein